MVYRSDFLSESVKSEWCGEKFKVKEN